MSVLGFELTIEALVIGVIGGMCYGLLAVGLVLIYRATRVVNFAHGELGALGAAILAKLVLDYDWDYWLALLMVVVGGALIGGVIELTVMRRLSASPRLVLLVATIGASQVLFFAQVLMPEVFNFEPYPVGFDRRATVGDFVLGGQHFLVLAVVPAVVLALTLLVQRTPFGLALRASAGNRDAARLAGINVKRVATIVWVLAGALAVLTAVMINPVRGTVVGLPTPVLGPGLLLRALAAALIGGLVSMPLALAGGIGVGVLESLLSANHPTEPGLTNVVLFVLTLVLVLVRHQGRDDDEAGSFSLAPRRRSIARELQQIVWVRRLPRIAIGAALATAVLLPFAFTTSAQLSRFSLVLVYALVALSVTVLTGWAGQLSLGQFAFVGLGAMTTAALIERGMPFAAAVSYATLVGVFAAMIVGTPALRIGGLHLAVTTLAFAVATESWVLRREFLAGPDGVVNLSRGRWWFVDLRDQRTYYWVCLVVVILAAIGVSRLRASGAGRSLIAVRENEAAAASFTVSPAHAKLAAFAVAGGLAALAGGLFAGLRVQFDASAFAPEQSLLVVSMAIIGGLGSVTGAFLGAVYIVGMPAVFGDSLQVKLLTSGAGLLILLLYLPGGLLSIVHAARDALVSLITRRTPRAGDSSGGSNPHTAHQLQERPMPDPVPGAPALATAGLTVRFGGRVALDDVSLRVEPGEVVGLIGANGAGKSTLLSAVGGFLRPDAGTVELFGLDISDLPPHQRARLGMGRVFQDARLFGDLTVRESVLVALESRANDGVLAAMLGVAPAVRNDRAKAAAADDVIGLVGLGRYADAFIADLSTGTRRITELACLLALEARVLLLDEPTAGVAQRETEAFGPLLLDIRRELDATILLVEHDMPLVMSISDRIYCLGTGAVLAVGPPDAVRADPAVIAAYLGTDDRAIERSDTQARERATEGDSAATTSPAGSRVSAGGRRR